MVGLKFVLSFYFISMLYSCQERKVCVKKFVVLVVFVSCLFMSDVTAKEVYYTNDSGVSFSKEEFDFLGNFFWDGIQDLLNKDDYQKFILSEIMNGDIETKTYHEILPRGTHFEDNNRDLTISKSCSSNCYISVTLTWKKNPTIRSYDVIGAYLENTKLINTPTTVVLNSGSTVNSKEIKKTSTGFGVSIKLPKYGNSLIVNQTYRVKKGGHVYASYQHAMKNISLANSKNYTTSKSGYGKVFNFSGIATSTYDRMNGVDIAL